MEGSLVGGLARDDKPESQRAGGGKLRPYKISERAQQAAPLQGKDNSQV
jgi:hypothetical protein